jgi:UDP-2,4-diacetamido-2,4,6-trideoxy-beta-L-altropyranose hydrolase
MMGTGHLMRMRAIAEGYRQRGVDVHLLTAACEAALLDPFRDLGVTVHATDAVCPDPADGERLSEVVGAVHPSWIVVDGYHFDVEYLRHARSGGSRILVIDDMASLAAYPVEVVVNQNAHADQLTYPAMPGTRLLRGPDYVLLRTEFRAKAPRRGRTGDVDRVLVTLGGADPFCVTEVVVAALGRSRSPIRATIVVGASNARATEITAAAAEIGPELRVVRAANDMRKLMAAADLAISTAGTTVWELAYMGVPALLIEGGTAERLLAAGLARIGLFEEIGRAGELDAGAVATALERRIKDRDWRAVMSERGMQTVDGRGVDRVLDATEGAVA